MPLATSPGSALNNLTVTCIVRPSGGNAAVLKSAHQTTVVRRCLHQGGCRARPVLLSGAALSKPAAQPAQTCDALRVFGFCKVRGEARSNRPQKVFFRVH